ncbi:peptidoglycan-binding protein [Zhengella mangrovi]|uniref:Peptidoglycan-binding protein n=1 Tax=Zhengella mangrovi TaxID=1982044 RepID=A0A2G1QS53_9HYPH|nr:peptidoglycan-binding domain-containing protein [Zhengella mangrovi]PHP68366.1 peptidoglycan-binding protein [Zhengella mangrovi]
MARTARQPDLDPGIADVFQVAAGSLGAFVLRNPVVVGGVAAFAVTLFYVSANAVWYQPQAHSAPLFATRDFSAYKAPRAVDPVFHESRTRIVIEDEPKVAKARPVEGDPGLAHVQQVLAGLKLYDGAVDGLNGPQTREAVKTYQRIVGLPVTGEISADLMRQLDGRRVASVENPVPQNVSLEPTGAVPAPTPRPVAVSRPEETDGGPAPADQGNEQVKRVQAGLRSFGNDQIIIDGLPGARTRSAIVEFQSLFGLPQTGEADDAVVAKMKEIGLIN